MGTAGCFGKQPRFFAYDKWTDSLFRDVVIRRQIPRVEIVDELRSFAQRVVYGFV